MKKTVIAALALALAASMSVPAVAETQETQETLETTAAAETTDTSSTFTTSDGVLSVELPNDTWKEVEDPSKWVVLSDGDDIVTIEHYSNGEKLPEMAVADDHYVRVYQAVASTQNEVFVITGGVVDSDKIGEVANIIMSAKVLKYDTKLAVSKEDQASTSEFSVVPTDKTMYVTASGLNVRAGYSTDDQILGTLGYGESVHVTGVVQRNGADYGWYQVSYGNGTGYVSANFLSDTEPEKKDPAGPSYTGNVKTVYDENGESSTLYECTDGLWRDKAGTAYTRLSETEFQVYEGTKRVFTFNPASGGSSQDPGVVTAYDENGTAVTLYESTDGYWYDSEGTAYIRHSDTDFQVNEGNKHLTVY